MDNTQVNLINYEQITAITFINLRHSTNLCCLLYIFSSATFIIKIHLVELLFIIFTIILIYYYYI